MQQRRKWEEDLKLPDKPLPQNISSDTLKSNSRQYYTTKPRRSMFDRIYPSRMTKNYMRGDSNQSQTANNPINTNSISNTLQVPQPEKMKLRKNRRMRVLSVEEIQAY